MTVDIEPTVICHKSYRSDNPSLGRLRPALPSRPPTPQTHLIRKIISKVISSDPVKRLVLGARLAADAVRIPLKQGRPQWTARRRIPNSVGVSRRELSDLPYARRKLPLKARDPRTKILYSNVRLTVFVLTDAGFRFLVFFMNAQSDKERFFRRSFRSLHRGLASLLSYVIRLSGYYALAVALFGSALAESFLFSFATVPSSSNSPSYN